MTILIAPDESGRIDKATMEAALASLPAVLATSDVRVVHVENKTVPADAVLLTDGEGRADLYPDLSGLTVVKLPHKDMLLDGVCESCACCGQPLTDSVSVQRGMGPVCSKKGYSEDPTDPDEMGAFICLSEFQELVEFLTKHYRPLGLRGLVNGLVRVASLNRPRGRDQRDGNSKLFRACCDAIEHLGYIKMSNVLRDILVCGWLTKDEKDECFSILRTKAYRTPKSLTSSFKYDLSDSVLERHTRTFRVRLVNPDGSLTMSRVPGKTNKRVIWENFLSAFRGEAVKINGDVVPVRASSDA